MPSPPAIFLCFFVAKEEYSWSSCDCRDANCMDGPGAGAALRCACARSGAAAPATPASGAASGANTAELATGLAVNDCINLRPPSDLHSGSRVMIWLLWVGPLRLSWLRQLSWDNAGDERYLGAVSPDTAAAASAGAGAGALLFLRKLALTGPHPFAAL